jgi:hypothetical protein
LILDLADCGTGPALAPWIFQARAEIYISVMAESGQSKEPSGSGLSLRTIAEEFQAFVRSGRYAESGGLIGKSKDLSIRLSSPKTRSIGTTEAYAGREIRSMRHVGAYPPM